MSEDIKVDAALFSRLIPLSGLRPDSQRNLIDRTVVESKKSGELLFKIGDTNADTLYVLEGKVSLQDDSGKELREIVGGSPEANHRLAHQIPRKVNAKCTSDVRYIRVDSSLLDVMLTWDQTGAFEVGDLNEKQQEVDAEGGSEDWMTKLLQMKAFQMVPPANLQAMFMRMESVKVEPGTEIIKQGSDGDYFYVVNKGRCLVTRETPTSDKPIKLAELGDGACFGEEALISDAKRNATVTMLTRGSLMRLSKDDFAKLLNDPLSRNLAIDEAKALVAERDGQFLDVRLPSEYKNNHLENSINIPLYMLRMKLSALDPNKCYVACCDSGRRSSVAGFILTQKGFEVYVLSEGIPEAT